MIPHLKEMSFTRSIDNIIKHKLGLVIMIEKGFWVTGLRLLKIDSFIFNAVHNRSNRLYLGDCSRVLKVNKFGGFRQRVHEIKRNNEL